MASWMNYTDIAGNVSISTDPKDVFGPIAPGRFDFSLLFQDTILSIVPSAMLLLLVPPRIWMLRKQPLKVAKTPLHENKMLFLGCYAIIQALLVIFWSMSSSHGSVATIPSVCLSFLASLALLALSHTEHLRSIRPSALINVYLLLTLLFDVVRARTLWQDGAIKTVAALFSSSLGVKLLIVVTEAMEKRDILLLPFRYTSPEATSGIYSRTMFWWLNTLMSTGFKRILNNDDLYPIDDEMKTATLLSNANLAWNAIDKTRSYALMWSIMKALRLSIAYCIFPRLSLLAFRYAQPFLISRTIRFANSKDDNENIGWGLTAAFGFVFMGIAMSNGAYYHMCYRFATSIRGSLVTLIYAKTVDLSITALDESAALTLMATDTETICQGFVYAQEIWAVPIEAGIAVWLLYREIGLAFMGPLSVALFSITGITVFAKSVGQAQKLWIERIQTRVDATSAMLGMMKAVKMLGFTDILTDSIQRLRVTEVEFSKKFRKLLCVRVFLSNFTSLLSPLVAFIIFVISSKSSGRTLDTATAFSVLSIITLLGEPLNLITQVIPAMSSALSCFERIQRFLESDARQDHRLLMHDRVQNSMPSDSQTVGGAVEIELQDVGNLLSTQPTSDLIVATNATFSWTIDGPPVVCDANFSIRRNQFTFIIGPVGSGKSSLLKALLGEMPSSKGFVYTDVLKAGYVDQTPWIQNGSVRENILGVSSYEEPWYGTVVRACALEQDIKTMPNGHNTLVGSAGISLSGGQKQRIALARAVYAKQPFIILDDVFSGLDAQTEDYVFSRLMGRHGLFRKVNISVLLVTHAVHRLPYSDHIIALNSEGRISEQGSYQTLLRTGGYVQSLTSTAKSEVEQHGQDEAEAVLPAAHIPPEMKEVMDEVAELNRQTGEMAVYKYYFSAVGWHRMLWYSFLTVLFGASITLTQLIVTFWTSAGDVHGNRVNNFYLGIYATLVLVAIVSLNLVVWYFVIVYGWTFLILFSILTRLRMVPASAELLHEKLLRAVMGAPLFFFTSTDTGVTTNRFSQDLNVVDITLPYAFIDLSLSLIQCLMGAILMCISAGYFATVMPAICLVVWVLQRYYLRTSRQIRLLDLEAKSPLYSHFIESLSGLTTIRAFGWASTFEERNFELLDASQKPYYLMFCIQRWLALILDMMVAGLAVILMVLIVKLRNEVSPGYVGLALVNVMKFNSQLAQIIQEWTNMETSLGAISRLRNFNIQTDNENLLGETRIPPEEWPAQGNIELRNVSASYTYDGVSVVKNLSMSIQAGEKIGICGRSGSGKSSLITTLFRMLELSGVDSSIIIDGIDITTLPRQAVRAALNAIPQEPFFLKGTIRHNADPRSQHDDASIISSIRKVEIWDLVEAKGGLDAELDTEFFSHGQRQLFCLARALLRKSKVLVLDEATSSVDVASDALMQRVIRKEFADCTILAVAHRLNTIVDFDRIAVLGDGELKEFDTPEVLLGRQSMFKELYDS